MRAFGWLLQIWHRIEPVERLDWILETLGLRERVRQFVVAVFGGMIMFVAQRFRDAPIDWIILMALGAVGLIFYLLNQLSAWSSYQNNKKALYQLNPNARPTVAFFTPKRLFAYLATIALAAFAFNLHRGPSGIEWPWSGESSSPPAQTPPAQHNTSGIASSLDNFHVSFSFPHLASTEVEIELRFLNHEDNPISVENMGVIELFGNDKEPWLKLDECYDPNVFEATKNVFNSSPPADSRTQGSYIGKMLQFVIYANPTNVRLNGIESRFPLEIPPKRPIIAYVTFPVDVVEKNRPTVNFSAVCPSMKLFDTRGQESVSVCPGLIDMTFSKEEYSADSFRVANLIAAHEKHLSTIGPSPESGNVYKVWAQRAGRFQLTPKMGSNSCPLVSTN
jgi:hypothetical protein